MKKDLAKSILSLVFALLPLLAFGLTNPSYEIEKFKELILACSIPGFLYFVRYQIFKPLIRDEMIKPKAKVLAICARAIAGDKDALDKLRILEEKIVDE